MDNALTIAAALLPNEDIRCAAFGVFAEGSGDSASLWRIRPIEIDPDLAETTIGASEAILAVGLESAFRIRLGEEPQLEAIPVCDLTAQAEQVEGQWLVRMKSAPILAERFGVAFAADFRVTRNDPWKPSGLAANLVNALDWTGDAIGSSHPILRLIARSIHAIQVDSPDFVSKIVPDEVRWKVKHSSISGFMSRSMEEQGWLDSFARAFEVEAPEDDEILLKIEPGQWILTDRRLCLISGGSSRTVRLAEVRRYAIRGLFTLGVDIILESGERIRSAGSRLPSEQEFSRCLKILRESGVLPEVAVHAHGA